MVLGVTQLVRTVMAAVPRQPVLSASAQFFLPHRPMPKEDTSPHPDRGCRGPCLSEWHRLGFVARCSLWSSSLTQRQRRFAASEMPAIPKPVTVEKVPPPLPRPVPCPGRFCPVLLTLPSYKAFQAVSVGQLYWISTHHWLLSVPPACFPNSSCWPLNPWKTRALVMKEVGEGLRPGGTPWST